MIAALIGLLILQAVLLICIANLRISRNEWQARAERLEEIVAADDAHELVAYLETVHISPQYHSDKVMTWNVSGSSIAVSDSSLLSAARRHMAAKKAAAQ